MSIFSSISAVISNTLNSRGDDNVAISAEQNNPFISAAILGARTTYDALNAEFYLLLQGKKASLKQITKAMDKWLQTLNTVTSTYTQVVTSLNELGNDLTGIFTLDAAKEAWEIIQDTPILRRYIGEANYWYLHDTLGLLALQPGSLTTEALESVKGSVKTCLLAACSAVDGLVNLESYLAYLQSAWGFLYVKALPMTTIDSVLPNVTTAYWYKPEKPTSLDSKFMRTLDNNPPNKDFTPVALLPIPEPSMALTNPGYVHMFNPTNPDTWYLDGKPYYKPNTMEILRKSLNHWGSSYTDANIPLASSIYPRRPYMDDSANKHPLIVGKTFAQLDTDKLSIKGSVANPSGIVSPSVSSILDKAFTPKLVEAMSKWQGYYEAAYKLLVEYILEGFKAHGVKPSTISEFVRLQADNPTNYMDYATWLESDSQGIEFSNNVVGMLDTWRNDMMVAYAQDNNIAMESVKPTQLFDSVMNALVDAGRSSNGLDITIDKNETFMVGLSFDPTSMKDINDSLNYNLGVPYVAYKVNATQGTIYYIYDDAPTTRPGYAVNVEYTVDSPAFVMFPSNDTTNDISMKRSLSFNRLATALIATIVNTPDDMKVGDVLTDGILTEFMLPFGMEGLSQTELGIIPNALNLHRSCGYQIAPSSSSIPQNVGNIFFPDGTVPATIEDAEPYATFYTIYLSSVVSATEAEEELADVVGYSINKGRESKFPCFGIYGNLLGMYSWEYKEMTNKSFLKQYAPIKSKSSLYYKKADPSHIVYYHSSYYSQSRKTRMSVYHEYVAKESKSYEAGVSYTYYVFPGESIAVYNVKDNPILQPTISIDAYSPQGEAYHYTLIRNPIPKCAKYVDPTDWSFMDVVYELLLLATNLASLCGDNGERLEVLTDNLSDFGISLPQFIGELPENNGQYAPFTFSILEDYATKIEEAIQQVYTAKAKMVATTNSL